MVPEQKSKVRYFLQLALNYFYNRFSFGSVQLRFVWFGYRTKLKQTEVDCEYLKRCVEKLTEENRRLQKEAMELRTLKLSPQFYGQMTPPTTLIMCPSCERVAGPSSNHQHNHRPVPVNPWVACAGQVTHGLNFEALRPRS